MQTSSVNQSVSQLANAPLPTLKHKPTKDFSVGRQPEQNHHVHAHAGTFLTFSSPKAERKRHFKLSFKPEKDFIQIIPDLFTHIENIQVVFHNRDYVEDVYNTYYANYAHLFLEWVKTFAIIRKADRIELLENVIQTTEQDFLTAFQLFQSRSIKPRRQKQTQKEKIIFSIHKYFPYQAFTDRDLEEKTLIYYGTIREYLRILKEEGMIRKVSKVGREGKAVSYVLID